PHRPFSPQNKTSVPSLSVQSSPPLPKFPQFSSRSIHSQSPTHPIFTGGDGGSAVMGDPADEQSEATRPHLHHRHHQLLLCRLRPGRRPGPRHPRHSPAGRQGKQCLLLLHLRRRILLLPHLRHRLNLRCSRRRQRRGRGNGDLGRGQNERGEGGGGNLVGGKGLSIFRERKKRIEIRQRVGREIGVSGGFLWKRKKKNREV
ncbi:unnamed protein product, partial [Linum tenue]